MSSSSRRPRVAFQGEHGAFSEDAAIKLLGPEIQLVPRPTFTALFKSLDEGLADYVLAPIENSLIGAIQPAIDLLQKSSLAVEDEVVIRIQQHLIGCPGAVFEEIEAVESHPAALAQCQRFFAENTRIKRIETEDTAGSVARIIEQADRKSAAIASRRAAELYGGSIIRSNLEDDPENYTRFALLSNQSKSSLRVESAASVADQNDKEFKRLVSEV
ncbi:MAG: prephenate dehydratase domain-containing protein [Pyrinomonadaceae bacterium]